jgi:hypothetical protein
MAKDLTSRQLALQAKVDSQTNTESIGSLSSLTTTDKTNVVASVNEVNSQLADITYQSGSEISTPSGFLWTDHPLVGKVRRLYDKSIVVDYDVQIKKSNGKTYYVKQAGGNDANDGLTAAHPLQTIYAAHNKPDVAVICLCSPITYYAYGMNGADITKSITFTTLLRQRSIIANNKSRLGRKVAGIIMYTKERTQMLRLWARV